MKLFSLAQTKQKSKKLKHKIFLTVFLVLLLQILLLAVFTFITFQGQVSRTASKELETGWQRSKLSIDMLKHRLYSGISFLRYALESLPIKEIPENTIDNLIYNHYNSIHTDYVLLLSEKGQQVSEFQKKKNSVFPGITKIRQFNFNFTKNKFLYTAKANIPRLYLITGTPIFQGGKKEYTLFFINILDNSFAQNMLGETGNNLAFFTGNTFICSDLPYFKLPENIDNGRLSIQISNVPYQGIIKTISSALDDGIQLMVLRSSIADNIYMHRLSNLFFIAFLITLGVSFLLAVGITGHVLSPFYRLNTWLEQYLNTGKITDLSIKQNNEIGFLTDTFYTMVHRIIKEEQIIRNQLDKISYLNKYNETIIRNLKAGVILVNRERTITYANSYFASLLDTYSVNLKGIPLNKVLKEHFIVEDKQISYPDIDLGKEHYFSLFYKPNSETSLKFTAKITPLSETQEEQNTLIVLEDITATDRLWQKVLITEKIASMGMLSAGMAHEINNPLGSILSHVHFLKAVEKEEDKLDSIAWIENETRRIMDIINRILDFSQNSADKKEHTEIPTIINETLNLLSYGWDKKGIHIKNNIPSKLHKAAIRSEDFKQVFLNILLNAKQAISETGEIEITGMQRGKTISVTISDTGEGIKQEDMKNIFNPFFTTKNSKKGNGLGLSLSYSIIQRAGGDIRIESTPGIGTKVEIYIPAAEKE